MNLKLKALILLMVLGLAACSTDEDPSKQPEGDPSITAEIGGEQWEAAEFEAAVNVIPQKGQYFELDASNGSYRLNLSILEFGTANGTITQRTYEGSDEMFLSLFLAYEDGPETEYRPLQEESDEEVPVRIKVTASTNSRITGTFSGVVYKFSQEDEEEYPEFLIISNGAFNNLPFETHTVNIQ